MKEYLKILRKTHVINQRVGKQSICAIVPRWGMGEARAKDKPNKKHIFSRKVQSLGKLQILLEVLVRNKFLW